MSARCLQSRFPVGQWRRIAGAAVMISVIGSALSYAEAQERSRASLGDGVRLERSASAAPSPRACDENRASFAEDDRTPIIALLIDGLDAEPERWGARPDWHDGLVTRFLALPPPVSFTVDPQHKDAAALIERIRKAGHEAVLRLPIAAVEVDPREAPAPGSGAESAPRRPLPMLHSGLMPAENAQRMRETMEIVDGYVGVYAGAGAPITANAALMKALFEDLKRERCILIDGRSSNQSIVGLLARRMSAPSAPVSIRIEAEAGRRQAFAKLERAAMAAGPGEGVVLLAVAAPETLVAIERWLARRVTTQTRLAPISAITDRPPPKRW